MIKTVLALAIVALATASDVLDLGDSDFADTLADHDIALVKFYAPWCGHCKRLAPEFDKASAVLSNSDPPVALVKVDCTAEGKDTCSKYGVSGYPTLKIFKRGEQTDDYNGERSADGIVKYMRSKAGPSSKAVADQAAMDKFLGVPEIAVVGFFDDASTEIAKQFQKLADSLSDTFRFAHSHNKEVNEKAGYSNNVVIMRPKVLQNKFEDSQLKYDGEDTTLYSLKSWVNDNIYGLAGQRTSSNSDQFKKPLITAYYDVDYVKNPKGTNYWRNRVMKVAKKFDGKNLNFAIASKDEFSGELSEFGVNDMGDKPVVAARNAKDQKFVMEAEFSMDTFEQFLNDFLDDKIEPYLKSEAIPDNSKEAVKVAVGRNFDELVNDETKDVLIEFYAPWCGHCKTLAPKYEELAEMLKDEDSVAIVKMDATANDVPSPYEVRGFPTLFYAPKGSKGSPKKYEGGREVDDFLKYLARESTDGLTGFDKKGKKIKKTEL